MTLEVRPLAEGEINSFTLLAIEAFQSGIGHLLTGPNTAENVAKKNANTIKTFREKPSSRFLKVVDTDSGEIVAGALWHIFSESKTQQDLDKMFERLTVEQGYRQEYEPLYAHLVNNRRELMGMKPYLYLDVLFTGPEHHRRGAGGMLIKWGADRADELGLECYLESSVEARPLYERHGFKVLKAVEFDMSKYGRPDLGVDVNCVMHRDAIQK